MLLFSTPPGAPPRLEIGRYSSPWIPTLQWLSPNLLPIPRLICFVPSFLPSTTTISSVLQRQMQTGVFFQQPRSSTSGLETPVTKCTFRWPTTEPPPLELLPSPKVTRISISTAEYHRLPYRSFIMIIKISNDTHIPPLNQMGPLRRGSYPTPRLTDNSLRREGRSRCIPPSHMKAGLPSSMIPLVSFTRTFNLPQYQ